MAISRQGANRGHQSISSSVGGILWRNWGLTLKRVETHNIMGVMVSPTHYNVLFGVEKDDMCPENTYLENVNPE